jgi:hypothetical protein
MDTENNTANSMTSNNLYTLNITTLAYLIDSWWQQKQLAVQASNNMNLQ